MLEELENTKLIRELNYLKSEIDYKNSLIQLYNIDFLNSVDNILNTNSDLKKIYDEKKNIRIEVANRPITQVEISVDENIEIETDVEVNDKLKGFYRQIAKMTHPDKIKDDSFNLIYSQASTAFKEGKTVEMILLCDKLNIPFQITQEEKDKMKEEIQSLKNKILLLESSYSYQWALSDESIKSQIALSYIKTSIS